MTAPEKETTMEPETTQNSANVAPVAVQRIVGLDSFYSQIPSFKCKPGCTDCCGPVPFSKEEWNRVADKRKATSIDCPYANQGCDIYANRPLICRMFGAGDHPLLACPHGCGPEKKLSASECKKMIHQYHEQYMV
jgi:hypothetical protein